MQNISHEPDQELRAVDVSLQKEPFGQANLRDSFGSRQLSEISHVESSIDLSWKDIRYAVTTPDGPKELLKGVAGTAKAGRTLVIMGPSGAGKSTLLNALSGRLMLNETTKLDGVVCLNDCVFSSKMKRVMSFVAQDDIIMPKETPNDAFRFSLAMKHSKRTPDEEEELVRAMIEKLRLKDCQDTIMGIPGVLKGVSGGEKKRTNIGVELITNPPIMMLDEPTSGLDSVSALRIGHLMRDLAREEGRTVICTLHTPSSELFQVFDDLLLMAKGHTIYHGSVDAAKAYFASIGMPCPPRVNPSEYYMRVLQSPGDVLDDMAEKWVAHAEQCRATGSNPCVNFPPTDIHETNENLTKLVEERQPSDPLRQLTYLSKRSWRNTMRDPMLSFGRVIQTIFFGVLIGLLYINLKKDDNGVQDRQGCLYLFCIQNCFMSLFPALLSFPAERPVFLQDMTSKLYSPTLYYWSKVLVEFPMHMLVPTIYAIIVYFMADFVRTGEQFFIFLLLTLCLSYCAQAIGMLLSAIFEKAEVSLALGPLILMPMIFVGGLFANTERLEPGWVWLTWLSFVRYTFKGMMRNEFLNLDGLTGTRYPTGESVIAYVGFDKHVDRWQVGVGVVIAMMIFLRVCGCLALVYHARKTQARLPYPDNHRRSLRS